MSLLLPTALSEELKPNYVYGGQDTLPHLTATTELGGLDNCRQVRSNTYDDPQHLAATNGGALAVPTYETVHSAKKEMLNASGPPVLNPVYGPTGTPTSPLSPNLPPSKGARNSVPNPVYSESGSSSHQLPVVSPLSPVYAAVDKSATAAFSDPVPLHYASTTDDRVVTGVPESSNGSHNNSVDCPPPLPLYEELRTSKRADTLAISEQELGDTMVRNESYGLLMRNGASNSSQEPPKNQ